MSLFRSALTADFQREYGLRLAECLETHSAEEIEALIAGLPEDSLYTARLTGEPHGRGWRSADWVLYDLRNAAEAQRAAFIQANSKKGGKAGEFREYPAVPGAKRGARKKHKDTVKKLFDSYRIMSAKS